jgi:malonyl-CoA O-methyltransferase
MIREAYTDWSASYDSDRNLTRDLDEQVTREALAAYRVGTILELGCGTGKNTTLLASLGGRVAAFDFSPGMIARAQAKFPRANVLYTLADLTQPWPCARASADLIVGNLVLEHIRDPGAIFGQAARALRGGGRCFISELHPFRQYQGKQAAFSRGEVQTEIPVFVHHISEFLTAAEGAGLALARLGEHWHAEDDGKPPRLVTFLFEKPSP